MKHIYDAHADLTTEYGPIFNEGAWTITLWHPLAKEVKIIIFDKNNHETVVDTIVGDRVGPNIIWKINKDIDGYFYNFEITQEDGVVTLALDPFARSMAPFNWEGGNTNIGKGAFVKIKPMKQLTLVKPLSELQPIIYEANIRDITSLDKSTSQPGSFNAISETRFSKHLSSIGMTHIQLLPVHNCYAINESDKTILMKNCGAGWSTNYNWGYDPHNYFSLNGWYSTDPSNPYSRINEFKNMVANFHEDEIGVIIDVVYNHLFTNDILNNVIPGYYFRDGEDIKPVDQPALASERLMVRKLIIDSLKFFVTTYDVDGFRFDLSCFTDKETINLLTKELRELKPNIILHGEAWPWSDLNYDDTYIKGHSDNDLDFAYFNDTTRNAIKGEDDADGFSLGILGGNMNEFPKYLASIVGNTKHGFEDVKEMSTDKYDRFTSTPNNILNYSACHDGHTLWDKINLTVDGNLETKLSYYRQAIMMQQLLPGRTLYLQGTELLYSKPNDHSGQDSKRFHTSDLLIDPHGFKNREYNENSYRTTDYTNGINCDSIDSRITTNIFDFIRKINVFKKTSDYFKDQDQEQIINSYKFNVASSERKVIDLTISSSEGNVRIIHNFSDTMYPYESNGLLQIDSTYNNSNILNELCPHSSILIYE